MIPEDLSVAYCLSSALYSEANYCPGAQLFDYRWNTSIIY